MKLPKEQEHILKTLWDETLQDIELNGYDRYFLERYRDVRQRFREQGYDMTPIKNYEIENPLPWDKKNDHFIAI